MKKFLLSFALATTTLVTFAQQDPQFTMWQFDRQSFNPAVVGTDKMHCLTVFHRDQWDQLDRDPKTYLVNYQGAFGAKKDWGGGLTFFTEVLGQQTNTVFRLALAKHIALSNGHNFSAGLSLGSVGTKLGGVWNPIDEDDNVVNSLRNKTTADAAFGMSLGFTLYKPKQYYVGLSSTNLTSPELKDVYIKVARHYYLMGGYEMPIGNDLALRPNVLVKSDLAATQLDINADVLWNGMLWGGLSYRLKDAIAPYAGFQMMFAPIEGATSITNHGLKLGYSYDVTTSALKDYSAGSHEIFLTYCMSFSEIPMRARHSNPRFL
jgi:type IX secretion system PorP/SprF family membrane protein